MLQIPAAHQRRLRTTDCLERLNQEIKRSPRVATLLPNEASLLRPASAGLAEISDDWETERAYPNREPDDPPLKTAISQNRCCWCRLPGLAAAGDRNVGATCRVGMPLSAQGEYGLCRIIKEALPHLTLRKGLGDEHRPL